MTRDEALALVHEYTQSEALRRHMYAVEIAMRAMAERAGEDPDRWGLVGLLHDFDYERFPNEAHSPTDGHPSEGVRLLAERGLSAEMQRAILGHASYTAVPRDTAMARALFAVDELAGFLVACALVRPSRSLADLEAARAWVATFVAWYNNEHLHSGIRFVTPAQRHHGLDIGILAHRHKIYTAARARRPERWTGKTRNWEQPKIVVLNPEPVRVLSACMN